jgi:hypothetical protein
MNSMHMLSNEVASIEEQSQVVFQDILVSSVQNAYSASAKRRTILNEEWNPDLSSSLKFKKKNPFPTGAGLLLY